MRGENWAHKLDDYLQEAATKPFEYGACDCVCYASDWVMRLVNIDPMYEGRGQYTTLKEGAVLIKKFRGSYEGIMDHYFPRVPIKQAMRGDIVLHRNDDGEPAFGIVNNGAGFFKGYNGLNVIKLSACNLAWRVD